MMKPKWKRTGGAPRAMNSNTRVSLIAENVFLRKEGRTYMRMIWLIRHGECVINTGLAFSTFEGAPLTPRGHQQAHQVASLFAKPPAVVATSSYLRAQQTAQPTLQRFPHLRAAQWPIQEFTYVTFPTDRAVTKEELQPQAQAYWERCDPAYCDGPRAESFTTFMQRVQQTLVTLRQRKEHFLVLFTHELFMAAVTWVLLTQPGEMTSAHMRYFQAFAKGVHWPHASILKLGMDKDLWIGGVMTAGLRNEMRLPWVNRRETGKTGRNVSS